MDGSKSNTHKNLTKSIRSLVTLVTLATLNTVSAAFRYMDIVQCHTVHTKAQPKNHTSHTSHTLFHQVSWHQSHIYLVAWAQLIASSSADQSRSQSKNQLCCKHWMLGVIVQSFFKRISFYVTQVRSLSTLVNPTKSTKPKLIKPSLAK